MTATITLHHGNCVDVLAGLPDASVDAVVTDPPYGLANTDPLHVADTIVRWVNGDRDYIPEGAGFMGKAWDAFVPPVAVWDECLRVLKPGGHVLTFAGSRTVDLMTLGLRLAGFEIRDSIAWLYGSGFPKSLDVSKAIDKAAGAEREVDGLARERPDGIAAQHGKRGRTASAASPTHDRTPRPRSAPATDAAREWEGWGTALKPGFEPVVVGRKPLTGTVAANVLAYGTGALNIDACRIGYAPDDPTLAWGEKFGGGKQNANGEDYAVGSIGIGTHIGNVTGTVNPSGRWPANVILDEDMAGVLDQMSGNRPGAVSNGSKTQEGHVGTDDVQDPRASTGAGL